MDEIERTLRWYADQNNYDMIECSTRQPPVMIEHGRLAQRTLMKFLERKNNMVIEEIKREFYRQDEIWGTEFDDKNTANDWAAYITRYINEGAYDGREHKYTAQRFRENLVKAAALCVSAIEAIDRNGDCAKRHYD